MSARAWARQAPATIPPIFARPSTLSIALCVWLGGLAGIVLIDPRNPTDRFGLWAALTAACVVGEYLSVRVTPQFTLTPAASAAILLVVLVGPLSAVLATNLGAVADGWRRRLPGQVIVANAMLFVLLALVLGAATTNLVATDAGHVTFFAICTAAYMAFSASTFCAVALAARPRDVRASVRDLFVRFLPLELLLATMTGAAAVLYLDDEGVALVIAGAAFVLFQVLVGELQESRSTAARLADALAGRQALLSRVVEAESATRRDLARALHDGPVQTLLAARQDLAEGLVDRAATSVERTVADLRRATLELHPSTLRTAGLASALDDFVRSLSTRTDIVFSVEVDSRVEDQPPELLYDIARELLVNASKHSNGRSVWCRVDLSESGTRVVVSDDGVGFDPGMLAQRARDGHVGLASIDARVAALGGSVSFRSTPGGGAVVKVVIPCAGEQCA